jgi:adenine-specific DNA-methyltransferase
MLPTLWMKAGAIGKCPTVSEDIPDMLILPENKFAVLIDEMSYMTFEKQIAEHPEIETIYIVTDSEPGYREMIAAFEGKNTYQLYRDYLDNFRINTGR